MSTEETTVVSISVDDIPTELLIERSQTLGRKIDEMRAERLYLKGKIAERLAAEQRAQIMRDAQARLAALEGGSVESVTLTTDDVAQISAEAPGALIEASASN